MVNNMAADGASASIATVLAYVVLNVQESVVTGLTYRTVFSGLCCCTLHWSPIPIFIYENPRQRIQMSWLIRVCYYTAF